MDEWLKHLLEEAEPAREWEPDFQGGQWLVWSRLGPLQRFYLRPPGFRPRFYHRLYPLPVCLWQLEYGKILFQGLCRLQARVRIRYQVTLDYVERHPEALSDLDAHVRAALEPLVVDLLDHRIQRLESGDWIDTGLTKVCREIEEAVNLLLARHHLRCRTLCDLQPVFAEPGDDEALLFQEKIYRTIEERRRSLRQLRFQERKRSQQERERHEAELARLRREAECEREIAEGRHRKKLLEIRQRYRAEVREMAPDRHAGHRETERERPAGKVDKVDGENTGRQRYQDRIPQVPGDWEDEDMGARAYRPLPGMPDLDTALALRDGQLPAAALEPRLEALLDNRPTSTEIGKGQPALAGGWLRRLLRRLLFFLLGAR